MRFASQRLLGTGPSWMKASSILLCSWILLGVPLHGDVIFLLNGNEIQGEILSESESFVIVQFPGGTLRLEKKKIQKIQRQNHYNYMLQEAEKALRQRSFRQAIDFFRQALKERSDSQRAQEGLVTAREKLGEELQELHRYNEAILVYEDLLAENPENETASEGVSVIRSIELEAESEEKRARGELERNDVDTALWRFKRLYDRFPSRRHRFAAEYSLALVVKGNALSQSGQWAEASDAYYTAASVHPLTVEDIAARFAFCQVQQIRPYVEAGKFELVGKLARDGLHVAPSDDSLNYYLGLALEADGKERDAAHRYRDILRRQDVKVSRTWSTGELRRRVEEFLLDNGATAAVSAAPTALDVLPGEFRKLESRHFVVHHKNQEIGLQVLREAERSYAKVFKFLECKTHWHNPCEITVFPSEEEYQKHSDAGQWSGALHRLAVRRGRLSDQRIYSYQGQPRLVHGVLTHEVAHALLWHRLNFPERVPLWANEGFAVSMEPGYIHEHYHRLVSLAHKQKVLSGVNEIFTMEDYPAADKVSLYYAQCFSLVDFLLRKKGTGTFVAFLKDLTGGRQSLQEALKERYGYRSALALYNAWTAGL